MNKHQNPLKTGGVYCIRNKDNILYVGSSSNLWERFRAQSRDKNNNELIEAEFKKPEEIRFAFFFSKNFKLLEKLLIRKILPPCNRYIPTPDLKRWKATEYSLKKSSESHIKLYKENPDARKQNQPWKGKIKIPRVTKVFSCCVCGKNFEKQGTPAYWVRYGEKKAVCSLDCNYKLLTKHSLERSERIRKEKPITRHCENCGNLLKNRRQKRFCSIDCKYEIFRGLPKGEWK